jgi:hypothetical protein
LGSYRRRQPIHLDYDDTWRGAGSIRLAEVPNTDQGNRYDRRSSQRPARDAPDHSTVALATGQHDTADFALGAPRQCFELIMIGERHLCQCFRQASTVGLLKGPSQARRGLHLLHALIEESTDRRRLAVLDHPFEDLLEKPSIPERGWPPRLVAQPIQQRRKAKKAALAIGTLSGMTRQRTLLLVSRYVQVQLGQEGLAWPSRRFGQVVFLVRHAMPSAGSSSWPS